MDFCRRALEELLDRRISRERFVGASSSRQMQDEGEGPSLGSISEKAGDWERQDIIHEGC